MLAQGFSLVFANPFTVLIILLGVVVGIIFGAIPGLSATMAVAMCLPMTYSMSTVDGIGALLGLYIGGISGGLISAILINIPGTPSSVATCFDGHPMALHGQAGKALGVGIFYSFIGTIFSIALLIMIAPVLANLAVKFGPYEYFSVTVFAVTLIITLSGTSLVKGVMSGFLGLMLAMVGLAPVDNVPRYTFGTTQMMSGFNILVVLIGMYAISEIFSNTAHMEVVKEDQIEQNVTMKGFGFSLKEFKDQTGNMLRSALIGVGIGILPGIGGGTSNILAYSVAKNQSKHPEKFGTGIMDGVVASETSNNASIGGAMIPLLTLGIPGDSVTAILLGGLTIKGVTVGPLIFDQNGTFVYAIYLMMLVASVIMLVVESLGIKGFIKILSIPKYILLPIVLVMCMVGAYGLNSRVFDMWFVLFFGILGYLLLKLDFPLPPLILGFILEPTMETNLRRGLMSSQGSFLPFLTNPISAAFLIISAFSIVYSIWKFQSMNQKTA